MAVTTLPRDRFERRRSLMRQSNDIRCAASARAGLTRTELAIILAIVFVAGAILLPSVGRGREAARRTQCSNNLRNIGVVFQNRDTVNHKLPGSGTYRCLLDEQGNCLEVVPLRSWQVDVLSYLGRQDVVDSWDFGKSFDSVEGTPNSNAELGQLAVKVLTCPEDRGNYGIPGGSSFAVNAGYSDLQNWQRHDEEALNWNDDDLINGVPGRVNADPEDSAITRDTGLFWTTIIVERPGRKPETLYNSRRLNSIWDGASQTILVAENTNAGLGIVGGAAVRSWANPWYQASSFVFPAKADASRFSDFSRPELHPDWKKTAHINGQVGGANGNSPFPSSYHLQGANFLFADGAVKFLSQELDEGIYGRLLTPGGTRQRPRIRGHFAPQDRLPDTDF